MRILEVSIPAWYDWKFTKEFVTVLVIILFQFQHGTIGSLPRIAGGNQIDRVSIPAWYDWKRTFILFPPVDNLFQFQHGTIGRRLLLQILHLPGLFQFQHGTIGSLLFHQKLNTLDVSIPAWYDWKPDYNAPVAPDNVFQFQHGTIGSCMCDNYNIQHLRGFNSSMVRLEETGHSLPSTSIPFQFQHGTIGRHRNGNVLLLKVLGFNSSMVRLEEGYFYKFCTFPGCFNSSMVRLEVCFFIRN